MNKRVIYIKSQYQMVAEDIRNAMVNAMIDSIDHQFDNSKYAQEITEKIVRDSLNRCFYELR